MNNLITITPSKDNDNKDILIVSLTVEGAELINEFNNNDREVKLHHLYDNEPDMNGVKLAFSKSNVNFNLNGRDIKVIGGTLYTQVHIPQENAVYTAKRWNTKNLEHQNLIEQWKNNPKFEAFYYPNPDNEDRMYEISTKLAANHWAVYSDERVGKIAIEINQRHNRLAQVNEKLHEALQIFSGTHYKKDKEYDDKMNEVSNDIESEIDYCLEKMKMIKLICGGDYNSNEKVSVLYRKHRGVIESSKEKLNLTVVENEEDHTSQTKEATSPVGAEGQNDQSPGPVGEH